MTIGVLDKDGAPQTINTIPDPGRTAAAAARAVAACTEDKAVIDALAASAAATDAAIGAKADDAASSDAGTFSLIALFKRLLERVTTLIKTAGQGTMANSHPVAIASDQSAVAVKTTAIVKEQEITRPSNADIYAINDVVGNTGTPAVGVLTDFFSANGASGYLAKFELWTSQAANVAPYRIHLFNAAPTAIADNAAFTLLYADIPKYLGYIDISNMSQEGGSSTAALGLWTGQLLLKAAVDSRNLHYVITTKAAFTPASAQTYTARGGLDSNG